MFPRRWRWVLSRCVLVSAVLYVTYVLGGRRIKGVTSIITGGDVHALHSFSNADGSKVSVDVKPDETKLQILPDVSEGYQRAEDLPLRCAKLNKSRNPSGMQRVSFEPKFQVLYCPMCKVASTFFTRVFRMLERNREKVTALTPFDIPISDAPASKQQFIIKDQMVQPNISAKNALKFLFVRSPYSLLFSAYVDKLVKPNPDFWGMIGRRAVQRSRKNPSKGDDVTFSEFVDYVTFMYQQAKTVDCHVMRMTVCRPCDIKYNFVGKMETFRQDTTELLSYMKQSQTLDEFQTDFSKLHAIDAIDDVTSGVFWAKEEILKYMPWHNALKRIWRTLQIRGVIGHKKFPLSDKESDAISKDAFISLLVSKHSESKPKELSFQKKQAFIEAYRTIAPDVLEKIRRIYSDDFFLFNYETHPENVYNKTISTINCDFLDYSNIDRDLCQ